MLTTTEGENPFQTTNLNFALSGYIISTSVVRVRLSALTY